MIQKRVTCKTVIFEVWELRNAPKVAQGAKTAPKRGLKVKATAPFFEPFSKPCSKGHAESIQSIQGHQKALEMVSLPPKISTKTHQFAPRSKINMKKLAGAPTMRRDVFWAMLKTQYQVA